MMGIQMVREPASQRLKAGELRPQLPLDVLRTPAHGRRSQLRGRKEAAVFVHQSRHFLWIAYRPAAGQSQVQANAHERRLPQQQRDPVPGIGIVDHGRG